MEWEVLVHIWAAMAGAVTIFLAIWTLFLAAALRKYFGGNIGKAVTYGALAFSCTLLVVLFYYASGIYFELNGLRYPSWTSELVVSTFSLLNIYLAFLAATTLKKTMTAETKDAANQISDQLYEKLSTKNQPWKKP